jgi:hypothetical protein
MDTRIGQLLRRQRHHLVADLLATIAVCIGLLATAAVLI